MENVEKLFDRVSQKTRSLLNKLAVSLVIISARARDTEKGQMRSKKGSMEKEKSI